VLAWRKVLEARALSGATIRRKLAALSSLFGYLCDKNAVDFNPVRGATRPKVDRTEGRTPALGDHQACALLAVLLHHGLRRDELFLLKVKDIHDRCGVPHPRIRGRGNKLRSLPLNPAAAERIHA
jgi:site-specific recombinase XerD